MTRILIPVDGSDNAIRAVQYVMDNARMFQPLELHLLNVQIPIVSGAVRMFIDAATIRRYHEEEGEAAMARTKTLLDAGKVPYTAHLKVGHAAEAIVATAQAHQCDLIVMGSRGLGAASGMWLGSVAAKTLHLSRIPVTVVK